MIIKICGLKSLVYRGNIVMHACNTDDINICMHKHIYFSILTDCVYVYMYTEDTIILS